MRSISIDQHRSSSVSFANCGDLTISPANFAFAARLDQLISPSIRQMCHGIICTCNCVQRNMNLTIPELYRHTECRTESGASSRLPESCDPNPWSSGRVIRPTGEIYVQRQAVLEA